MCKYCDSYIELIDEGNLIVTQNGSCIEIHTGFGSSIHQIKFCWECGKDLRNKNFGEKSFSLRCNKCGGITIVSQKKTKPSEYKKIKYNNKKIRIGCSAMEETYIFCKCGNSVDDE